MNTPMHSFTLDLEAMLALWKRAHGYEPSRTDCTLTRVDGPDIDSFLEAEIRQWYIKSLMELPSHMLPLTDIASRVTPVASPQGAASVALPADCLRVISVGMANWEQPASSIIPPDSPQAMAQANAFARAGICRPVAIFSNDTLTLTLMPDGGELTQLLCVMLPAADSTSFLLTPAMLSTLTPAPGRLLI